MTVIKDFLTVEEFADKLCVSAKTIRRAILKGKISAINMGNGNKKIYRIPVAEIARIGIVDLEKLVNRMVEEKITSRKDSD